jgi:flagellar motor switch protein FliN/FliY
MTDPLPLDSELDPLLSDDELLLAMGAAEDALPMPASGATAAPLPHQALGFYGTIPVEVTLEVASTQITLQQLMDIDTASVIILDKLAGDPLDVKVNGALFARAEVVVLNGNYGLRVVELCPRDTGPVAAATQP